MALAVALVGTKLYYQGRIDGLDQQTPMALAFALLLSVVVLAPAESLLQRSLGLRVVVLAGLVSYSLFLVHDPLVRGFRDWGLTMDGRSGFLFNLFLIGGLAFTLAGLTYRFVEKPALARKRPGRRVSATPRASARTPSPRWVGGATGRRAGTGPRGRR